MEFFTKTMAVKLRSHMDKYLVADDDRETIRQRRKSGGATNAKWLVEMVEGKDHAIRLKSCHGRYLTASDVPFLLGMTGKKVLQTVPGEDHCHGDWMLEWEPIRDGFQVKLKSWCGKYLRANGGTPPWRNSLTHDDPQTGATQKWILWDVEAVEISESDQSIQQYLSSMSSLSSVADDILSVLGSEDSGSPRTTNTVFAKSHTLSSDQDKTTGMDFFRRAKVVRLRSHHDKYLVAEDDEASVTQARKGSSYYARWTVEFVIDSDSVIRLKSCYGNYLTASNQSFLMGMTGRKVLQTRPKRLDSSVEWEPIREGSRVRLRTRYGNFLRANGGMPPWRNSVTHDIPHRSATQDWILWEVDVLETLEQSDGDFEPLVEPVTRVDSSWSESTSGELGSGSEYSENLMNSQELQARNSFGASTPPAMSDGRTIYYHIADENGYVEGEDMGGFCLNFKGNTVAELTCILEKETGMRSIAVCSRSPLNGNLVPLRLRLPPNIIMHVVVVPSSATEVATATATGFSDESTL